MCAEGRGKSVGGRIDRSIYREREEVRPSSVIHLVCVCLYPATFITWGQEREKKNKR